MDTPRYGHEPIKMNRVINGKFMCRVGDYYFDKKGSKPTLILAIPSPQERPERMKCYNHDTPPDNFQYSRWPINHPNILGEYWTWDDNEESPTITPSLHAVGYWHGFVQNGYMRES